MKKISKKEYNKIIELYPLWKALNSEIKALYTRGVNFHEIFSEFIVCYVNDYYHSTGAGSEDAFTNDELKVQIKGTSNFNSDLTSFGPRSQFHILEFARLNQDEDTLYLYRIPIDFLYDVPVNRSQTFKEQQAENRRPRFSIIKYYIERYLIKPYAIVNMKTGSIQYLD